MSHRWSWPLRTLARLLSLRPSEALALGSLRRFRQFFRFAALFGVSVMVPAGLLAYIAFQSSASVELQLDAELDRRATAITADAYRDLTETFDRFETATADRLLSGQSPLANLAELSPYLRAAFRFDGAGELVAPFELDNAPAAPEPSTVYRRHWTDGAAHEHAGDHRAAARAFEAAAEVAVHPSWRGQAELAAARALARSGQTARAMDSMARLEIEYATDRDQWGFRIGDLAALTRRQLMLGLDEDAGRDALIALVEELLSDRWTLGRPGESAVIRRALDLLGGRTDPDWIGRSRIRLTERTGQLFWSEPLVDELELLGGGPVADGAGQFTYIASPQTGTLWASLWVGDSLYAFSFDTLAILGELKADLLRRSQDDPDVFAYLLSADQDTPPEFLDRQWLNPWFPSFTVVVEPKDPDAVRAQKSRMVTTRLIIIALAVGMSILGVLLSLRLVSNELESARMKADFAANVSHELRSPITHIRLKAESLQLDLVYDDDDRQAHYDTIVRESERLSRLVDNVLDFAAIERGVKKYTFRAEDPARILHSAIDAARTALDDQGMELDVRIPNDLPVVWVDREAIGQVMTNLLSNAAKYGADGKWIGVRAQVGDGVLEVSVADRGIGIAPAELDRVFDHFYRSADPDVRRQKGTGIGLTIVRYIVETHAGAIWVQSPPQGGSTFTFTLPLEPPAEAG